MKKYFLITGILMTCLFSGIVNAQKTEGIAEIRGSIKILEDIVNNPKISEDAKEDYIFSLGEKRLQLARTLKQQINELETQRAEGSNPDSNAALDAKIKEINSELKLLIQNIMPSKQSQSTVTSTTQSAATTTTLPVVTTAVTNNTEQSSNSTTTVVGSTTQQSVTVTPLTANNTAQPQQPAVQNPCGTPPSTPPTTLAERYKLQIKIACTLIARDKATNANATVNLQRDFVFLVPLALAAKLGATQAVAELTAQAENSRNDKQVGSNSSSSGTTTLVAKGAVPAIFGFAVENGAIERSTSGTTLTFRGNPVGILEALSKKGYIESYQNDSSFDRVLRNFSFGLSFDTSRGNSNGAFTADKQQLSAYSFRYNFVNERDPRDARFTRMWEKFVNDHSVEVVRTLGTLARRLLFPPNATNTADDNAPPLVKAWVEETKEIIKNAPASEVEAKLSAQLDKLQKLEMPTEIDDTVKTFSTRYTAYLDERDKILKDISKGWLLTAEYNNNRPVDAPSTSNFNFIAEKGALNGSIDLTANFSLSIFNTKPVGASSRLRDFHMSGQLDVPIRGIFREQAGVVLVSFAGRYERLLEDQLIPNTTTVLAKGDIASFQAKTVFPIPGFAFKIPISITFANRTELIKERETRFNFGFTFDFDSILAKFNPFSSLKP